MFKIDNTTIKITKGDYGLIGISAENDDETAYTFKTTDTIRFAIYEKKNYKKLILEKLVNVEQESEEVEIEFVPSDTKSLSVTNKPIDYWYEISLNPSGQTQTILGYDDSGAKVFRVYPEGEEE